MEVPVEAQDYIEQGNTLLWHGQTREAAVAFAHAAKQAPDLAAGHLGLAQANLALGSYGIVSMACRRVQELEATGPNAELARAILFLLDRRYDRALEAVEKVIAADPGRAYAHALRGYCLRQLSRDYEGALAEAKAERLAGASDFSLLFPKVAPPPATTPISQPDELPKESERPQPTWQPPSQLRRQVVRARFATRGTPVVTLILIGINVLVFLAGIIVSRNISDPAQLDNPIYAQGVEYQYAVVQQHEYWRILTAMFLHAGWLHIGLNMLSLYFIGPLVEQVYGTWRYLVIYLVSGLFGGILVLLLATDPFGAELGASGAIFGVFGTLGIFFWQNRRAFGGAMLGQWLFWLVLNMYFTFANPGISVSGHIGGLSAGLLLGLLLMPRFWTPVQTRLNRGRTGGALVYVLKPLALVLVIGAGLILLAISLGHGR